MCSPVITGKQQLTIICRWLTVNFTGNKMAATKDASQNEVGGSRKYIFQSYLIKYHRYQSLQDVEFCTLTLYVTVLYLLKIVFGIPFIKPSDIFVDFWIFHRTKAFFRWTMSSVWLLYCYFDHCLATEVFVHKFYHLLKYFIRSHLIPS